MENSKAGMTFRLRHCPADADARKCATLLSLAFGDVNPEDIQIQSLAFNLDPWERPRTKMATVMFRKIPTLLSKQTDKRQWELPVQGLNEPLILDTHFLGFTPLNDIESESHEFDCIAISGLASHPFGSWQPKGGDKSFMWIRETLPRDLPMMRAILYGYDSTLLKSNSFQTIGDLASSLVNHIKANGWHLADSKRLVFLAHSLGGIVVKEAFWMMANGDSQGQQILDRCIGGVFFGVPSHGMETSHLLAMVRGQVNEEFVNALSSNSDYLRDLDKHFEGLGSTRHMNFRWAFETKTSPTVTRHEDGHYSRSGPEEILVTKESATRNLYHLRTLETFQIDENHSDMVKFRRGDPNLQIVKSKLRGICELDATQRKDGKKIVHEVNNLGIFQRRGPEGSDANSCNVLGNDLDSDEYIDRYFESLEIPGRDNRLETIDNRFSHSFEWIFDEESTFVKWLREGSGMFWVHGKPGSGKSTLMKFIFQSQKAWELLHNFSSDSCQMKCSFFFHDRGTSLQKSFEGFLRSILNQILEKAHLLARLLYGHLKKETEKGAISARGWSISKLESCFRFIFRQTEIKLDLFFVCDALDEYDGTPEFVCKILKDFIKAVANSPTKLKILFSSRPWDVFKRNFGSVQSIQLQDYTKSDIRQYCFGFVGSQREDISIVLDPLISVVIERANGVFLWVKLVLQELISEATSGKNIDELSQILSEIPDDLRDYYLRTIERTPEKFRMQAYIIFQALIVEQQLVGELDLLKLIRIIACSQASTYHEAKTRVENPFLYSPFTNWRGSGPVKQSSLNRKLVIALYKFAKPLGLSRKFKAHADIKTLRSLVMTITGGLVEFVKIDDDTKSQNVAQLAHQTIREFVSGHDFKRCILGHEARAIFENGYTFYGRYLLVEEGSHHHTENLLFLNERTTGRSLKEFMDTIPEEYIQHALGFGSEYRQVDVPHVTAPLEYALFNGLQLYLEDALRQRPEIFRETAEKLLSRSPNLQLGSVTNPHSAFEVHLALIQYVLDNGYTVQQDPQALDEVLHQMVKGLKFQDLKYKDPKFRDPMYTHPNFFDKPNPTESRFLEAKAVILIRSGLLASTLVEIPPSQGNLRDGSIWVQALHIAQTNELVELLVEKGIDINIPDSEGNRPLDHALGLWNHELFRLAVESNRHDALKRVKLLIQLGGTTSTSPESAWRSCLEDMAEIGLMNRGEILACYTRFSVDTESVCQEQGSETS